MAGITSLLVPLLLLAVSLISLARGQDVYAALSDGARAGLKTVARIVPPLVVLLCASAMLRASGAFDLLAKLLAPVTDFFGIPAETLPLLLVRPISGSAALALGAELMARHGPDSLIGRTAAVMLGSTETTFYTISVYCGAAGIRKTRYAIPAALIADLTGFVAAAVFTRLFLP